AGPSWHFFGVLPFGATRAGSSRQQGTAFATSSHTGKGLPFSPGELPATRLTRFHAGWCALGACLLLRSTGLSKPPKYACTPSLVSDRAKQGPMRSQRFLNRLVLSSSADCNDEVASFLMGFICHFLFFILFFH